VVAVNVGNKNEVRFRKARKLRRLGRVQIDSFSPASIRVLAWYRGVIATGPADVGNTCVSGERTKVAIAIREQTAIRITFMINLAQMLLVFFCVSS